MIKTPEDQELDDFYSWMQTSLPKLPPAKPLPPPSRELLDMARQTVQAHHKYLSDHSLLPVTDNGQTKPRRPVFTGFIPMILAAADGERKDAPRSYKGELEINENGQMRVGEYCVIREDLPADPDHQMLVFKCSPALLDTLRGKTVEIVVGDSTVLLGKVDRQGLAEGLMSRKVDLSAGYAVKFYDPD